MKLSVYSWVKKKKNKDKNTQTITFCSLLSVLVNEKISNQKKQCAYIVYKFAGEKETKIEKWKSNLNKKKHFYISCSLKQNARNKTNHKYKYHTKSNTKNTHEHGNG